MKRADFFKSQFFKAEDFADGPATFTIKKVRDALVGPEKALKCVVDVVEEDKAFVLNLTNFNALAEAFGEETNNWEGAAFRARRTMVQFSGKSVPAIRLRPITKAVSKSTVARDGDAYDDEESAEDAEYVG